MHVHFNPSHHPISLVLPYKYIHRHGSCRDRGNTMESVVATQPEEVSA